MPSRAHLLHSLPQVEAGHFFGEMIAWLEAGLLPLPEGLNAAERFNLLWAEHLDCRVEVSDFIEACLNPNQDIDLVFRTRSQRQLYLRFTGAISLLQDRESIRSRLLSVALSGAESGQVAIRMLTLQLWQTDAWPRVWIALRAQHGLIPVTETRAAGSRDETRSARQGERQAEDRG